MINQNYLSKIDIFVKKVHNSQQLGISFSGFRIRRSKLNLNSKNLLCIPYIHFFTKKNPFLTQISKRSTPTDLHHPDLHLAYFFSLESLIISSGYAKTSLGHKMEKFLQATPVRRPQSILLSIHDVDKPAYLVMINV